MSRRVRIPVLALVVTAATLGLLPAPAMAQDVDIQVHARLAQGKHEIVCDAQGPQGKAVGAPFVNCSTAIPYVHPTRWTCITDDPFSAYYGGAGNGNILNGDVTARWMHDRPGHSYHVIRVPPIQPSRLTPMAFPPGEAIVLMIQNRRPDVAVVYAQLAGYLGRDASAPRELACR